MNEQETDFLFRMIVAKYGRYLTPDDLDAVRDSVAGLMADVRTLRALKLNNNDAPFIQFVPYRADGSERRTAETGPKRTLADLLQS